MLHLAPSPRLLLVAASLLLILAVAPPRAAAQSPSDLNRLVHPDVAERLGLSDTQRADIQQLLQQRTEARQLEDEAARQEKLAALAAEIREQLSDEQWAEWQATEPSGGLRFQFREQPWPDVLQWFAEQEGLTLVMDRAPPGTFTYRDTREYTAAQAIDLLNSVLLTRGSTLVRREKMLTLLQLTDSIPLELLPEVTLEELPSRGNFELVRVKFPLGGRPVDAVMKEVTPYLGNFGRAIPLPQSGQLVVVETAGKMETINVLINSVPPPKKPKPAAPKEKPPEPVFAAYSLGTMNGEAVLETISKLVGSEGITVDSQTRLLTAFVVPGKQKAIQGAIEKMQENLGEARDVKSVAYDLGEMSPEAIRAQLQTLVPQAVIAVDAENQQVLVTGSSQEQAEVAAALEGLGMSPQLEAASLQVFQVEAGEADEVAEALQAMLPQTQALGNDALGTVVVRGPAVALQLAEEVITRWRGEEMVLDQTLKTFELPRPADDAWLATVGRLVPKAEIWLAQGGQQLVLLGSDAAARRLEPMLPQLVTAIAESPSRELRTYTLAAEPLARWQQLQTALADRLADVEIVLETPVAGEPAELLVWATEENHRWIAELVRQIEEATPAAKLRWPQVYPLPNRDPELIAELIATRFPEAEARFDEATEQLTVWAPRERQGEIAELLEAVKQELPPRAAPTVRGYRVAGIDPDALQSLLQPVWEDASEAALVTIDEARNRLLIRADEATHQRLETLIEKLAEPLPAEQETILMAYSLEHADAEDAKAMLESAVSGTTIVADAERGQLIATGTLTQQGQIKSLLGQIDQPGSPSKTKELRSYALQEVQAAALLPTLQSLWPDLELTVDSSSNQVIASATPREHQALQAALERLQQPGSDEAWQVKTYTVAAGNLQSLPAVLAQIAPQAVISTDEPNRTLVVWAGEAQHTRIAAAIEQLSKTASQREALLLFQVPPAEASEYQILVQSLFPTVKAAANSVSGQLTVLVPQDLEAQVQQLIEERLQAAEAAEQPEPQAYQVPSAMREAFAELLADAVENASIVDAPGADPRTVMVLAVPSDHARIAKLLERLTEALPQPAAKQLEVYRLQQADPGAVLALLEERRPQAQVISGQGTARLLIADTPSGHEELQRWLQELEEAFEASEDRGLQVYPIRDDLAAQAAEGIPTVAPEATILPGEDPQRLAILASPATHQRITQWLQQLEESVPPPAGKVSRVYSVRTGEPGELAAVLQTLLPEATFAPNERGRSLAATATEEGHQTIAEVVKQYDEGIPRDAQTRVFPLDRGSALAVSEAISQMAPEAQVNADRSSNAVIVTATAAKIEEVAQLVEELERGGSEPLQTESYVLENSNPLTLQRALAGMYPQATVAADSSSGGLLVAATPKQHEEIAKLVEGLNQAPGRSPSLQGYRLQWADPERVAETLEDAFGRRSTVGVSAGPDVGMVFVVGQADQQKIAADLIEQLDQADTQRPSRQLKVFALSGGNGSEVVDAVEQLFADERPQVEVEYDMFTEQLVVVGSESQLQRIDEAIKQFAPPERSLKIVTLTANDPEPVQEAIESLFSELPYNAAPSVLVDENRQQLLIRATPEQFEQIEQLLQQLDEAPPGSPRGGGGSATRRVRSIPVGPDSEALLRRLQEIWPSVRDNPLKILRPGGEEGASLPPPPADASQEAARAVPLQEARLPGGDRSTPRQFVSQTPQAGYEIAAEAREADDGTEAGETEEAAPSPAPDVGQTSDATPPPVVIVPGGGSWTVASEDPEAIAMLAQLLESTLTSPVTTIETGANHSVFILQHAAAEELETVLTNLFVQQQRGRRSRGDEENQTRIVADPRINALVVRGSRADRRTVESLLSVLDSPEFVGAFEPSPPQYVAVENTDAERVEEILTTVYRAQLSSGGGRPPVTIPAGISPELSTMLRQINATATGPLLTISVDEITNAIVLRAPQELAEEVRAFIEQIDQQAGAGRGRGVRIIPLQKGNVEGMEEALDALRRSGRRR